MTFLVYIFSNYEKFKIILWKHFFPTIKYLFSRKTYVCPIWIFIVDAGQAQINSEGNTSSRSHLQLTSVQKYNDDILVVFSSFLYVRTVQERMKSMGSIQRKGNCGKGPREIK
jgi:hypothetical protein